MSKKVRKAEPTQAERQTTWHVAVLATIVMAALVLGVLAFLLFSPASPFYEWAQGMLHPVPEEVAQANPEGGAHFEAPTGAGTERCRALTLLLVFEPGAEEAATEEAAAEEPAAGEDVESEDAEGGEPSPAEAYRAELVAAAAELNGGTAKTSAIKISITPVSFIAEEPAAQEARFVRAEVAARRLAAADAAAAAALEPATVTIPAAAMLSCVCYDPGIFDVDLVAPVVDAHGFAWELSGGSVRVELLEDRDVELMLTPIDLAVLSEEEFEALKETAGSFAEALASRRDEAIALLHAADGEGDGNGEDESPEPETPGNPGEGATPGNPGGGGGSGHSGGSGNGGGNGSGTGNGGGTQTHTHTWDMRIVIIGSHQETVVHAAWDEVVHHPATYNDWTETISRCSTCKEDITGRVSEHLSATGHSGAYTDYIDHHDLVSAAWDETIHHEEWVETKTVNDLGIETYCSVCGTVKSVEPM